MFQRACIVSQGELNCCSKENEKKLSRNLLKYHTALHVNGRCRNKAKIKTVRKHVVKGTASLKPPVSSRFSCHPLHIVTVHIYITGLKGRYRLQWPERGIAFRVACKTARNHSPAKESPPLLYRSSDHVIMLPHQSQAELERYHHALLWPQ